MDKKCCANCFNDRGLDEQVISILSTESGNCAFCHSSNVKLISPDLLRDSFELLIGAYTEDKSGKTLAEWFKADWDMFSQTQMDHANASALLGDIFDDGNIARRKFLPIQPVAGDSLGAWAEFKHELMHENRFFPKKEVRRDLLASLLNHLAIQSDTLHTPLWYRARIQRNNTAFAANEMGAPPKEVASNGRANPVGIPYLYLASETATAVSEVRPHTGENVCVAECTIPNPLTVIDLRNPRLSVSPFRLDESKKIAALRGDLEFLVQLGKELTRPVLPHVAAIDYLPSQYLCEFIKSQGYHGVLYKSSVGNGINLALFEPSKANIGDVKQHKVNRVTVELG